MIRLTLAEINRLRSRRLTLVALLVVLLGVIGFQLVVNVAVTPPSSSEAAQAQENYERDLKEYEENRAQIEADEQQCREENPAPDAGQPDFCAYPPPRQQDYVQTAATFSDISGTVVLVTVVLTGFAFLIIGGSFIGAEFSSGSIANWLTFIPQRWRVYTSKVVALAVCAAVIAAAALGLGIGSATWLTGLHGGAVTGLGSVLGEAVRGLVLVVVFALIGFALSLVARHTAASIGAVLAYLVLSFVFSILYFVNDSFQKIKSFLPDLQLQAFVERGYTYTDFVTVQTDRDVSSEAIEREISFGHSAIYWLVVLVVAVAGSFLVFRRRDVN